MHTELQTGLVDVHKHTSTVHALVVGCAFRLAQQLHTESSPTNASPVMARSSQGAWAQPWHCVVLVLAAISCFSQLPVQVG